MNRQSLDFTHTYKWTDWQRLLKESPNGDLLDNNAFYNELNGTRVRLLHVTTHLDSIVRQEVLKASTGCLIGSIYCVPLVPTKEGLRAHNLGAYIFEHEARRILKHKRFTEKQKIETIVIDVDLGHGLQRDLAGVNYLRTGTICTQTFLDIRCHIPEVVYTKFEKDILGHVARVWPFLDQCSQIDHNEFFELLPRAIPQLHILGYLYFEALCEYLMFFSRDEKTQHHAAYGELNCWLYKEFIFSVQPHLLSNFNLAYFRPSITQIIKTLHNLQAQGVADVSAEELLRYVQQRIAYWIEAYLIDGTNPRTVEKVESLIELCQLAPSLAGHCIDRELLDDNAYHDLHRLFDVYKAQSVWEYWDDTGIVTPFNGIVPKGEVGVSPMIDKSRYEIFRGDPYFIDGQLYMTAGDSLDITLVPELVDPNNTCMGLANHKPVMKLHSLNDVSC